MFDAHSSQHGEMGRESGCGGIRLVYECYCVVYEVEDASQKPPWRCKGSGRCSGAVAGIQDEG